MTQKYFSPRVLSAVLVLILCALPALSQARISSSLKEELRGYVEEFSSVQDPQARQAVLMTRGWMANRKERRALEPFKKDENRRVRLGAGIGLYLAGDRKADEFLVAEIQKSGDLFGTLREVVSVVPDDREAKLVKALLEVAKPTETRDVFRYLTAQKGALFDVLANHLTGEDAKVRKLAAEAVAWQAPPHALETTKKMLQSRDEGVRMEAVDLLVAFSEHARLLSDAASQLETALGDTSSNVREKAARRLVELNEPKGTSALLKMLGDLEETEQRQETMRFLLEHDVRPKLEQVQPYLEAEDAAEKRLAFGLAAASRDKKFVSRLLEMYNTTEFDDRLLAVDVIGRSKDPRAIDVLSKSLFEGRNEIRMAAAKGMGELANPKTLTTLRRALTGEQDKKIKLAVIDAIGEIESRDAVQVLRFQVTNSDPEIKKHTLLAIRNIGMPEGAKALDVLLRDRNLDIQWLAFLTAMELDEKTGRRQMASALRNPPDGFLDDVQELDDERERIIYEYLLKKGSPSLRAKAARRAFRTGKYDDVLRKLALDTSVQDGLRQDIVFYMANQGAPKDVATLEKVVRSEPKELARLSAWMLTRFPDKNLEPSFRGYLGVKDKTIGAIAMYGLATLHAR